MGGAPLGLETITEMIDGWSPGPAARRRRSRPTRGLPRTPRRARPGRRRPRAGHRRLIPSTLAGGHGDARRRRGEQRNDDPARASHRGPVAARRPPARIGLEHVAARRLRGLVRRRSGSLRADAEDAVDEGRREHARQRPGPCPRCRPRPRAADARSDRAIAFAACSLGYVGVSAFSLRPLKLAACRKIGVSMLAGRTTQTSIPGASRSSSRSAKEKPADAPLGRRICADLGPREPSDHRRHVDQGAVPLQPELLEGHA